MDVRVNMGAVLLATLSSMVIGSFWYGKVGFMKPWQKLTGMKPKKGKELQQSMMVGMAVALVSSFLMAYVLAHVTYLSNQFFIGDSFMKDAITSAFWMWLGFQGFRMLMNDTFEGRPFKLTLINAGNSFVTIMVMGLIIGSFRA